MNEPIGPEKKQEAADVKEIIHKSIFSKDLLFSLAQMANLQFDVFISFMKVCGGDVKEAERQTVMYMTALMKSSNNNGQQ